MSTDFNSAQIQIPQTVEFISKSLDNEPGRQPLKQNETRGKESTIKLTSQANGVVLTTTSSPTSSFTVSNSTTETPVVPQTVVDSIINEGFPALAKTTKPIPASVFSYKFASASNNQTPYYISSDIVLSGGIAQQTRRRIVHNEVERRRKDKINGWITKLADVIPKCSYGKQSKNIVLENAVEHVAELNLKLKQLEESQRNKNKLELENQALKSQAKFLQNQNYELIELLEKNKVPVPETLKNTSKNNLKQGSIITQTSKQNSQSINNASDNTNVTWSSSGKIPTTTTTVSHVESESLTSSGISVNSNAGTVQQTQPSFSMYTVSSIMNGLSQDVSLVDSTVQSHPGTVTLAIPVQTGSSSVENSSTAIPLVVTPNGTSHTLSNLVSNQNIHPPIAAARSDSVVGLINGTLEPTQKIISLGKPTQGLTQGIILGNCTQGVSQGIIVDNSTQGVPQGMTQVVLCQGSLNQSAGQQESSIVNVPKGPLVKPIATQNTLPMSCSLSNNTGHVLQTQGPVMPLGTSNSLQPLSNNRTTAVIGELNNALATTSTYQLPNSFSSNGGLVVYSQGPIMTLGTPSSTQAPSANRTTPVIGKFNTATNTPKAKPVSNSLLNNTGVVIRTQGPIMTLGTSSSMQPLSTNGSTAVVNRGGLVNYSNTAPVNLPVSRSFSNNTGLVMQSQGPIMTLGTPSSAQPLSTNRGTVGSMNASMPFQRNSSIQGPGSVTVINSPIATIPTLAANTTGIISGLPMTTGQASSGSVRVIPAAIATQGLATMTNSFISSANANPVPVATQTGGLVTMNVPTASVGMGSGTFGSITQQPNLVTLKLPKTTIQPVCNTSMTSNLLNTGTTPAVNLTPSPGTAFVIVRSVPSQQPMTYPTLPSQVTNFTSTSVAAAKPTPSAIIQPPIQQLTGSFQTPFTIITTPASTPVVNAVATNKTTSNSVKRSYVNSVAKSRVGSSSSSQPPAKVSKNTNGKKRQSSRSSSSSKSKTSKQKKTSQSVVTTITSSAAPPFNAARESGDREAHRDTSNVEMCQQDLLSIPNFSISSLIPNIQSQNSANKNNTFLNTSVSSSNEMRKTGGNIPRTKHPQTSTTSLRLSHSIDSLTGRRQEHNVVQQQPQQNLLSFSAESLLATGDDLVSSLHPMSCTSVSNTFTPQSTLTMTSFQDNPADGNINQTFSNFSAEALISETDIIGISNDAQTSRSNFTQGNHIVKSTPSRTQMFSDFSAESLINSSDLGSGLSYAIDNLISRSDNDNNIAMATVNPNLLHSTTSNLQDNMNHSMFTHNSSVPKNFSMSGNTEFQNPNTTTETINLNFAKYGGFTSPQKQPKDMFSFKPNSTGTFSTLTTSPTYLKHSVDSITASQYNVVSSGGGVFGSTLAAPSFNSLFSLDQINPQQYQVGGNPFTLTSNITRPSYQGSTMGSYA